MLEGLFGNKSAEKVMTSIYLNGELHASAIAQIHNTAIDPIKKQLERFEEANFLVSRIVGRSKLYKFNEKNPIVSPLKELISISIKNKSLEQVKNENEQN